MEGGRPNEKLKKNYKAIPTVPKIPRPSKGLGVLGPTRL
jgi:hypothetical protein